MANYSNLTNSTDQGLFCASEPLTNPLSVLLDSLLWSVLVVISDGTTLPLSTQFFTVKRKFEIYTIDANDSLEVDAILDRESDATMPSTLFIIICSTTCIKDVLQRVNAHDTFFQEQGVLTYLHRWLLITENFDNFQFVEKYVSNIVHLSTFVWKAEQEVYSAMWEPDGRILRPTAIVANGSVIGDVFPNLQYGLNGRHFIVATNLWGPFVSKDTSKVGNERYSGFCIELMQTIAEKMNFTLTFTEPPDGKWGDISNGSWTGLVKELAYKTSDMMTAPLIIQSNREEVMDFAFPYYIEEFAMLYKQTVDPMTRVFLFIRPYKWEVWACVIAFILITGALLHCLSHSVKRINDTGDDRVVISSLSENLQSAFGAACNQGTKMPMKALVIRLVFISWMFTCVIYAATYSSNLVALLTVDVEQMPFDSLEALSRQQQYKFGVLGGTTYVTVFKTSPGVYASMWERMTAWEDAGVPVMSLSHRTHLDLVDEGNYVYLTDATAAKIHLQTSCQHRVLTDKLFPLQYGIAFQNNSAYRQEVSEIIMRLSQTGVLGKWVTQYWPKQVSCVKTSSSGSTVGVQKLSGLFYVGIGLLVLATGLLYLEICVHKKKKSKIGMSPVGPPAHTRVLRLQAWT